ncbi:MAG TPA: hypothetical protein VF070_00655 [Streptosporangiaceae bacterium]
MRHVPDGVLRRLLDEPLSVPDAARHHLETCGRCRSGSGRIAENAALASRLLAMQSLRPSEPGADADLVWARLQHRLAGPEPARRWIGLGLRPRRTSVKVPRYRARWITSVPTFAGVAAGAGLVAGGVAAAATLTTVFAPTSVAPVPVNSSDLKAVATVMGLGTGPQLGAPGSGSGSQHLAFGTLTWSSVSKPQKVGSIAAARALTNLAFTPPATLPAGVGPVSEVDVQPAATATIRFSPDQGRPIGGTSLTVTGGPGMVVQYGSKSGSSLTTLGILTARRPVATSTGATTQQLENFVLSRPGMPTDLTSEIRLLGNLGSVLPVPVPAGANVAHIRVGGAPAVLISVGPSALTAVIWESHDTIHAVAGLLDSKDVLNVAGQIG